MGFEHKLNIRKILQSETSYIPKQRRNRVWLARFAILIIFGLVLYFGYCWGLWGRHSLFLQYLFQCSCPSASTEARYPDEVDVIVPACRYVSSMLSPSGRLLYMREKKFWRTSPYLLDLQTMERIGVIDQSFSSFLTDDLWFVESGLEDEIIDRTTGMQYPIQTFRHWQENAYVDGEPNLELLVYALHQAGEVFYTQSNNDTVVVLMMGFPTNSGQSFTFSRSDIPRGDFNTRVEQFLRGNNVTYQTILPDFPDEVISPDGRFVARTDGIYLVETNRKIAGIISRVRVRGWANDGRGAIYSSYLGGPCLLRFGLPLADDTACIIRVPQPVLMLKVPQEYLSPIQTP